MKTAILATVSASDRVNSDNGRAVSRCRTPSPALATSGGWHPSGAWQQGSRADAAYSACLLGITVQCAVVLYMLELEPGGVMSANCVTAGKAGP